MNTSASQGTSTDFLNEAPRKATGALNVLTILTIIGCIIGLIGAIYAYTNAEESYKEMQKAVNSKEMEDAPEIVKNMVNPETLEVSRKSMENKLPLLLTNLVGIFLCFWGAMEMRKLKKQGYVLWLAGEVLPVIAIFFLIGGAAFSGIGLISLIIPVIFIILYTIYRKDLRY